MLDLSIKYLQLLDYDKIRNSEHFIIHELAMYLSDKCRFYYMDHIEFIKAKVVGLQYKKLKNIEKIKKKTAY